MNQETEQFLKKMHELVRNGKRYFVRRTRNGVSYIQQLADLGITSVDEAWDIILDLKASHCISGPEYDRGDPQSGEVVWIFKMDVNGLITYIKLKDEYLKRGCVCLSFHEDEQ